MKYRVFWAPNAEDDVEAILTESPDQTALAKAVREIDGHLLSNPLAFCESRYDSVRIGFVLPLGVEYEVFDDVRTVIVHGVWRISNR